MENNISQIFFQIDGHESEFKKSVKYNLLLR